MYTVYIIKSESTGKRYIGYTSNIEKRIRCHNSGNNISTKNGRPWKLVYSENYGDKKTAWLREHDLKSYKGGQALKKLLK